MWHGYVLVYCLLYKAIVAWRRISLKSLHENSALQKCKLPNVPSNVYQGFVDYRKAFDKVQHGKLTDLLQEFYFVEKDMRIITNLYLHQEAAVRLKMS